MAFKLKQRGVDDAKKILIYGNDGTGKSTFAAKYCKDNGLNPIVIDVDDTNYTDCDILDLTLTNDVKTFNAIKEAIQHIGKSDYDTIILDGVSSLIEMLVSKDPGIKKYEVRNDRFKQLLKAIRTSGKNIIFIGQADMRVVCNDDYQSNKLIIKVNSIVNEKYHCFIDADGKYGYEVEKFREAKPKHKKVEETPLPKPEPVKESKVFDTNKKMSDDKVSANFFDSPKDIADSIIAELPSNNTNLLFAKMELKKLVDTRVLSNDECPPILAELERALA